MKILVVHDEDGNIKSAAVSKAAADLRIELGAQRGELVTEVETTMLTLEEFQRDPGGLGAKFQLDAREVKLIRKNRPSRRVPLHCFIWLIAALCQLPRRRRPSITS